jgi:protein subunit release factor B
MNLNESFPVSPGKRDDLLDRIARLNINPALIEETFTRGGGKGGQKINKTSIAVVLRYAPLGLVVKVQRERQRSVNRFLALRELVDQIEEKVSPRTSARTRERGRVRKQKDRRRRRAITPSEARPPATDATP